MSLLYEKPDIIVPKHYPEYFAEFSFQLDKLEDSATVYVGNLSFSTEQYQIHRVFSNAGLIKEIHIGLNKETKTPAGFCFVVFYDHQSAMNAVYFLNETVIDGRNIKVEIDWGFSEGREFGRAKDGSQMRDFKRRGYDKDREVINGSIL